MAQRRREIILHWGIADAPIHTRRVYSPDRRDEP
ncbi:hypothetical protein KPNJ1_02379 [Klebsiella pneumoniae 30660/NJST258_1]|uniref:Uncharacterized protein n=1 Tax=Klebsiella pneumoniae 30684/NJST258_2 TaxID=1420013 RepID=W8UYY9_KLEPN|nr:hypothetical protein KPNJ2_02337 [Klebsiella pneumoniae 30684/NJST258_2]AHM84785.1 hypothetical protein KPNJ1_02379 [Klebsiella pneumoniae 30660/NJST258_1]